MAVWLYERAFLCKVWCVKDVAAQLWWHGARGSSHSSWFKTLMMVFWWFMSFIFQDIQGSTIRA